MTAPQPDEKSVFLRAIEIDGSSERAAFLDATCAGNPSLRAAVEALLLASARPQPLLDLPDTLVTPDQQPPEQPGGVIGPYKLIQRIGEGGMGLVFVAEQQHPVRRTVALKVIKPGMDSRQVVARFEAERQALALMDHPNIARVFDGGATGSGRPYFVMELVRGVPITGFCDENCLPPRERLTLFVQVCQAVQHAHQKGIIHRDIKPSNVLVTSHDGTPVVKVIDFGVAKAIGQQLTDRSVYTQFAQMIGTPLYMSPEQAGMSDLDIDTRSDIYSLGVLLYELLTGTTPFSRDRFREADYDEIRRIIREEEPPRPSARLSESKGALPSISAQRQTEPAKLTRLVRGELDWIVMKALEKDRNRRYETANGFAADVQRYLADEPVHAVPPSAGYRFRKFARRNKRALATAAVLGVALLLAVGSLGWVVRDRAAGHARTTTEVNQFLQRAESLYADNKLPEAVAEVQKARGVLEAGRGDEYLDRRVRQWLTDLDTAAKLEEIRLESYDMEDRERVLADYAQAFREYGIDVEALPIEAAAARIAASQIKLDLVIALDGWAGTLRSAPRPREPARWQRLNALARSADPDPWLLRLLAAAEARDVQALRDLANGADPSRLRTRVLASLGSSLRTAGDAEAAIALFRMAQRQYPGDFSINSNLASCLEQLKQPPWDEMIAFRRAALAVRPQSAWAHGALAYALRKKGRLDEAIVEYREAIRLRPGFALAHNHLGLTLLQQKKPAEAEACLRKTIEIDPNYTAAHTNLGLALHDQKKLAEAAVCFRKAIELDSNHAETHLNLGIALYDQKKLAEAVAAYRKAVELDPNYTAAHNNLGLTLHQQKKPAEAEVCFRKTIELDPKYAWAHNNLGLALFDQNKLAEAETCFRKGIELDPKYAEAHIGLGRALRHQKKLAEAVAAYRKGIELDPKYAEAHNSLGIALYDQKKLAEAEACFRKAIELDPNHVLAHNNVGLALSDQKKLDEAVTAYREAIRLKPDYARAHYNLGNVLYYQKKLDEAVTAYREAIRLTPDYARAHYNLGIVLYDQKKLDGAVAAYRKAIAFDPNYVLGHNSLGWVLAETGRVKEAIAAYEEAIRLKHDYLLPHGNLALLLTVGPDPQFWDGKRAVELMNKVEPLGGKTAGSQRIMGLAQYRAGNWKESRAALEESMKLAKGGDSYHWFGLALAHQQLGDNVEARKCYDRAVEWMDKNKPADNMGELRRLRAEAAQLLGITIEVAPPPRGK